MRAKAPGKRERERDLCNENLELNMPARPNVGVVFNLEIRLSQKEIRSFVCEWRNDLMGVNN